MSGGSSDGAAAPHNRAALRYEEADRAPLRYDETDAISSGGVGVSSGGAGASSGSVSVPDSVEVSVPTDLTITSDADTTDLTSIRKQEQWHVKRSTAGMGEGSDRLEMLRTIELLRLQVSAREQQLTTLKTQHRSALTRLTEQTDGHLADKQVVIDRLEGEAAAAGTEGRRVRERAARELAGLTHRCAALQATTARLCVRESEVRAALDSVDGSRAAYDRLRALPPDQLDLRQYAQLRVHERVWPLRLQLSEAEARGVAAEAAQEAGAAQLRHGAAKAEALQRQVTELQQKVEDYSSECLKLRDQLSSDDFRVQNFSRVKQERDSFEEELVNLRRQHADAMMTAETTAQENRSLSERLRDTKMHSRRTENEATAAKQELAEVQKRHWKLTTDCESANKMLRAERERTTELHNKYINVKAEFTVISESLQDLQRERTSLREKLHETTSLNVRLENSLDEINIKNKTTQTDLEKYKIKYTRCKEECEAEISELRTSLLATTKSQSELSDENFKINRELQKLQTGVQHTQMSKERELFDLNKELKETKISLKAYQDLEKEYEQSLKALSSLPENETDEGLARLFPSLCLKGNKAIEQTVKLSRKVLQLERANCEACSTIEQLTSALEQLRASLYSYKCAVASLGEPSRTLQQRIVEQQDEASSLHTALQACRAGEEKKSKENKLLRRDVQVLLKELESCGPRAAELKKIKGELSSVKDVVVRSLQLGGGGQRGHSSPRAVPAGITISKDVRQAKH